MSGVAAGLILRLQAEYKSVYQSQPVSISAMTRRDSSPPPLQQPLRQATRHAWFERLARFGIAAKGVVYFVVGLLAAQAAFGVGGRTTDTQGALREIVVQPFGKFLLSLITIGIIGYVCWRLAQTILDPEHAGERLTPKHIAKRLGYAFSAVAYTGLAFTAVKLILGKGGGNGDATQDWTARFLAQPFGQWLVGLAGVVVIGVGISYIYEAYTAKFQRKFKQQEMTADEQRWTKRAGQFGIAARGIVFALIGLFLVLAAIQSDASQAKGLGGALTVLAQQPFGAWLLGLVSLGLIAYSIYSLVEARYLRVVRG